MIAGGAERSRAQVFVSYSHQDRQYLDRLRVHIRPLERDGLIDYWDDQRIKPGAQWKSEIKRAVESARVAVLLVTADFYASDFIAREELPELLASAARNRLEVLPVIVKQSRYTRDPALSKFQAVNDPKLPLAAMSEAQQEEVWDKVAQAIEAAVAMDAAAGGAAIIDAMEGEIREVLEGAPATRRRPHSVMVEAKGKTIVGTIDGTPRRTITAEDFKRLPREDLAMIRVLEQSMQRHYEEWALLYPQRADAKVQGRLRAAVRGMKEDLNNVLSFLERLGLDLQDHYSQIRHIVSRA